MPSNLALERLSESRAIGHALALAFAKQGSSGIPENLKKDQRDAYVAE